MLYALLAETYELGVVYSVVVYPAARNFNGAVGYVVDKRAVVADEDNGLGVGAEKVFEPLNRLYVEVVCGLVEQEHVGFLEQYFCKFYAHAPAAAELRCGSVEVAAEEAQTCECALNVGFIVVACH